MPQRKRLSANQKAQIVLEVLREDKTVAQIASENKVHPNQIHKWKKQALSGFADLFTDERQSKRAETLAHEREIHDLYAEIGRLSAELSWLKKKSGVLFE